MKTIPLYFYTAGKQFFVCDKATPSAFGGAGFWSKEALHERLGIGTNLLGVPVECCDPVKSELNIFEKENASRDLEKYDHVVEGSIEFPSGILQVWRCLPHELEFEIEIKPGAYRLRIYSLGLPNVYGDEGDDFYTLDLWPEKSSPRKVIKQWE